MPSPIHNFLQLQYLLYNLCGMVCGGPQTTPKTNILKVSDSCHAARSPWAKALTPSAVPVRVQFLSGGRSVQR